MLNNSRMFGEVKNGLKSVCKRAISKLVEGFWWPPLALALVVFYWHSTKQSLPLPAQSNTEHYGQYGDSFGPLTSLFTALGFGGLIITLAFQQRQIRNQEEAEKHYRQKEEKSRYEEVLFRLLDLYRQTLMEVRVSTFTGRDVLRNAIDRVDKSLKEENVHSIPQDIQGRYDARALTETDRQRIDYLHFRNFKIVSTEIAPQGRLIDTFEVLLKHMVDGTPDHLLNSTYRDLVFAQVTYIECRYFFLVALAVTSRPKLRDLMARSGFLDRLSRSSTHLLHRQMYEEYWGEAIQERPPVRTIPMSTGRLKRAFRAHQKEVGEPRKTYVPIEVRRSMEGKATDLAQTERAAGLESGTNDSENI